jgi:hypothetical protein
VIQTATNQRRATRVECQVPARLSSGERILDGLILDVSRSGVRLRVPGGPLGVYRLAPLALVARCVASVLGETFQATLHPDRLGMLVTKTLRPVRIGQRTGASADVDIGCLMEPALSDLEASALGLALPVLTADGKEGAGVLATQTVVVRSAPPSAPRPAGGATPSARPLSAPPAPAAPARPAPARPAPAASAPAASAARPAPSAPAATPPAPTASPSRRIASGTTAANSKLERWRAYVHPRGDRRMPPFLAAAESVTSQGVQLRVMDRGALTLKGGADVASTIVALDEAYGTDVALKLVDGPTHLWTGPARIEEVEVPPNAPKELSMWLAFARALRPAELRALGLQ